VAGKPAAIEQILDLQRAFIAAGLSDVWYNRFLASVNTTNDAAFMDDYIKRRFPAQGDFSKGDGLPLFLNEYGQNGQNACALLHRDRIEACAAPDNPALRDSSQNEYNAAEFKVGIALSTAPADSSTGYFYGFGLPMAGRFLEMPGEGLHRIAVRNHKTWRADQGRNCWRRPVRHSREHIQVSRS
jgi:hypothetical protein